VLSNDGETLPEPLPTAFPRSSIVNTDSYSVSIPIDWIPPEIYFDRSEGERLVHIWQDANLQAYVILTLEDVDLDADQAKFEGMVESYDRARNDGRVDLVELIDREIAQDGSIRYSHRFAGGSTPQGFGDGQVDIFYLNRAPYLVMLEMYIADTAGNRMVPTMQLVLDSLRVKGLPA
jgi:hypothetical protein